MIIRVKVIILFVFSFFLFGCSNVFVPSKVPNKIWNKVKKDEDNYYDFRIGDIIVKEKKFSLLGLFGHVGIMKSEREIIDYPKIGESIKSYDIGFWLEENRKFLILRYIYMNEDFEKKLLENLNFFIQLSNPYNIFIEKETSNSFYCSQFIWYLYFKTAEDLGFLLDIDSDDGFFVFPYDFISSKSLFIVH